MAGDWIKMRTSLATDPAVIGIADQLNINEFEVVGILHHLWTWADAQSRDGHANGVTIRWVNRYVHRDGFAEAMVAVGWLVVTETGIEFPNFERHNGETAKARALAKVRKQKQRASVTPSVPNSSRSERDESVTREEKRRDIEQQQQPADAIADIDARKRFEMFEGWAPDQVSLAPHLKLIGVAGDQITAQVVAEFVSFWMTRDTMNNQAAWCRELVASVHRNGVRAAASPSTPRPGRTSQHVGLQNQDPHAGLEANTDGTYKL